MASGWGLTSPSDEEGPPEGSVPALKLQYIWLEVMSLSDCNEMADRVNKIEICKQEIKFPDGKATSNVTLCVSTPANPKRTVEHGE